MANYFDFKEPCGTPLFLVTREPECEYCGENITFNIPVITSFSEKPEWDKYIDICLGCEDWTPEEVPNMEEQIKLMVATFECFIRDILTNQPLKEYKGPWRVDD